MEHSIAGVPVLMASRGGTDLRNMHGVIIAGRGDGKILFVGVTEHLKTNDVLEPFQEGVVPGTPLMLKVTWHDVADDIG